MTDRIDDLQLLGMKVRRDGTRAERSFIPFRQPPPLQPPVTIAVTVLGAHASVLKSAIDELSYIIGRRLEGPHAYDKEAALTDAAIVVGQLRAAINEQVSHGRQHYA